MSKVYQFNFEKTYKEIEVNGITYKVEFNDDALTRYRKAGKRFDTETKKLLATIPEFETATDEEIDALQVLQTEVAKDFIETFFGEGTFDPIYTAAGKSVTNLTGLINYLTDIFVEEEQAKLNTANKKYKNNGKK